MSIDHFSILGLKPGRYEPREVWRRFEALRRRLLVELDDPARYVEVRRRLNQLHLAYHALCDPRRQAECARAARADDKEDRLGHLRRLIESSLEGGLLRYSRRVEILAEGRRLGFSEFHTQLLIAQVQFGEALVTFPRRGDLRRSADGAARVGARLAAAGVLGLAIFLAMVRWLGA